MPWNPVNPRETNAQLRRKLEHLYTSAVLLRVSVSKLKEPPKRLTCTLARMQAQIDLLKAISEKLEHQLNDERPDRMYSIAAAAQLCKVSPSFLQKAIRQSELPPPEAVRGLDHGRYRLDTIQNELIPRIKSMSQRRHMRSMLDAFHDKKLYTQKDCTNAAKVYPFKISYEISRGRIKPPTHQLEGYPFVKLYNEWEFKRIVAQLKGNSAK